MLLYYVDSFLVYSYQICLQDALSQAEVYNLKIDQADTVKILGSIYEGNLGVGEKAKRDGM